MKNLTHEFFYSGFNKHKRVGCCSYCANQFFSYRATIGVVLESKKQKNWDGETKKVFLLSRVKHSSYTSRHMDELLNAVPKDYDTFIGFPLKADWAGRYGTGRLPGIEDLSTHLYEQAIKASKAWMTNRDEVNELKDLMELVERWRQHFGTIGTPKNYARSVLKWKKLFADPVAYEAYVKEARKKRAKATRDAERLRIQRRKIAERAAQKATAEDARQWEKCRIDTYALREPIRNAVIRMVEKAPASMLAMFNGPSNFAIEMLREIPAYKYWDSEHRRFLEEDIRALYTETANTADDDYVMPLIGVDMHAKSCAIEIEVSDTYMQSSRGCTVLKSDVERFLNIREHGGRLLGHKFTDKGYTFVPSKKEGYVTVGCHEFPNSAVDGLDAFLNEHNDEAIAELYESLEDNLTEIALEIRSLK